MKFSRTVLRATQILHLLSQKKDGMTISEISAALDMPQASTHDIVKTLDQAHFLRHTSKKYTIGFAAREVGDAYELGRDLISIARTHIREVAEHYVMTGVLVIPRDTELEYALEYRPQGSILAPADNYQGPRLFHAAAAAKVLIAFSSPGRQQKLLHLLTYENFTRRTICSEPDFLKEIKRIKARGYAMDNREYHDAMTSVSAPIILKKTLVGAVSLLGLHVDPDMHDELAFSVKQAAGEIAMELLEAMEYSDNLHPLQGSLA